MEDDDHSDLDLLLSVVEEQHEVYFHFIEGIRKGGCVFCLISELFSSFYPSDCAYHVDDVEMLLMFYGLDAFELIGLGREVDSVLDYYI